jgi:hypothetical protein
MGDNNKLFPHYIAYLEKKDFSEQGLEKFKNKPCVILVASENCGHCVKFKPTFIKVAKELTDGKTPDEDCPCYFSTVVASGKDSDKDLINFLLNSEPKFLTKNNINIRGYPTVLLKTRNNKYLEYDGNRQENDFMGWVTSNI